MILKTITAFTVLSMIFLFIEVASAQISEDAIIDEVAVIQNVNAPDLYDEIVKLVTGFVNDTNDYNGIAIQHNHTYPVILFFRGRITATMAPLLSVVPGNISDTGTLKGKLAARLKNEVQNYLLVSSFWDFENVYQTGTQYFTRYPNTDIYWSHNKAGPWWEKFYAVWAYCYYSGDWSVLTNNNNQGLNFLINQYNSGTKTQVDQKYAFIWCRNQTMVHRNDPVNFANGLIGLVRILDHFNHANEQSVRAQAKTALGYINSSFVNVSADSPIKYDYPPGECLTPEIARYLKDRYLSTVTARVQETINNTLLKDRYNAPMMHNYSGKGLPVYDESQWGFQAISFQLFNLRALVMDISPDILRKEKPWPAILGRIPKYRDMLYIRSLYYLYIRHGTVNWQVAEPD